MRQDRWTVLRNMGLLGTKWSRHVTGGNLLRRSIQVGLLGVDAIYLGEALDTVRTILLPCWALLFKCIFSTLDQTNLSKDTRRQNTSEPSSNHHHRYHKFLYGNSTG